MPFPLPLPLVPLPATAHQADSDLILQATARVVAHAADHATATALVDAVALHGGLQLAIVESGARARDIVLTRTEREDEGYELRVTDRVEIDGSSAGLFYGVQTLIQLLTRTADDTIRLPGIAISDKPRFAYRGVMLDVARNFFSVADVKAFIDRAVTLKFNHLHLHLSDDQGWRIEILSRPLLTQRAASGAASGRPGGFYSQNDFREIVAYAADRHMVVVPEIDLPGHTHAIGLAYPEIMEAPVLNAPLIAQAKELGQDLPLAGVPYGGWGVGHSSVKISEEETYTFVSDVLSEIASLTPGPYLHVGGDECLGTDPADFAAFMARVTALVCSLGKTPLTWHEAGSADVAEGTIGQYWGSTTPQGGHAEEARAFIARGGQLVFSPSDAAYLDMKPHADFPIGLTWTGITDLERAYSWEPGKIVDGVPSEAILGVEAPLWTETIASLADVDSLFFPRAAAIAEIAWSPAGAPERTWDSFRARVGALGANWQNSGWSAHRPDNIEWSTR